LVAVVVLGLVLAWQQGSSFLLAQSPSPEGAPPATIVSEVLGRTAPISVENPELALGRVTVMPGAVLPVHFHPGTQIGVVVEGELTYTVMTGQITWYRAGGGPDAPELIRPGETVVVRPGDALIEAPDSIHQGRNEGSEILVIYLSTLFPADAPRAVVVEASPVS